MDDLRDRVEAVERALTDGDGDLTALADGAATAERVDTLAADLEDLRDTVADLEAATQALRGYVGNVRSVNEAVERRADAAAAAVESLEDRVDALEADRPRGHEELSAGTAGATGGQSPTTPDSASPAGSTEPREGAATRRLDVDRGADDRPEVCHACGRETDGIAAAADGGRRDAAAALASDGRATTAAGGRSIGGFDPTDESHRVRLEAADERRGLANEDGEQRVGRGSSEGATGGFLARMRELL